MTGLHIAAYFRVREAVNALLGEKCPDLKDSYSRTPLSYAAEYGHEAMVALLLEKGAELDTKDTYGWTPLSYAAGSGHEAVVKLLLEKGAELEIKDTDGWTPLSYAARNGREAVVELLLEKGADPRSSKRPIRRTTGMVGRRYHGLQRRVTRWF
jgi:ankyrin repeat protein